MTTITAASTDLFCHVTADKAALYRAIMAVFAAAKRQYRLQLRPDEVLADASSSGAPPTQEEIAMALAQTTTSAPSPPQPQTC